MIIPPAVTPPRQQLADKREAILAAALELFAERGFDGTAMPMVAERAGVGAGTIYRHFESKEALGNAIFRQAKLVMQEFLLQRRRAGLTPREEFREMWLGLWAFFREHPAACRFLETQGHATYLDAASRATGDAVFVSIADFVRRGQAAGAIRPAAPAVLIAMALGAFIGLVKEADAGRFVLDDAVVTQAEPLVWDLLRA